MGPKLLSQKTYEHIDCVLCGNSETGLIAKKGQFGWPTYVSICKNCGLVFLNPRWTKEDYNHFYATEYDQYYRFDEEEATERELRKSRIVWERLQRYASRPYKSALDIGCGLGWSLHYFSQQTPGLAIAGIEPSDYCADHFVSRIGGELVARDVDTDWHLANLGRFDLITFRQVLEHLMDPIATLQKVSQALSPQGILYVAVPDMMHPDGSLPDFWYRCVHTYYFSKSTLARVAAHAGLDPVIIQEENSELWAIFRRSKELQEPAKGSVYKVQLAALRRYKRKRLVRSVILLLSPRKVSSKIPKPAKKLIPKSLKTKFRHLVYRH